MSNKSIFIPTLLLLILFSLGVFVGINITDENNDDDLIETTESTNRPVFSSPPNSFVTPLIPPVITPSYTSDAKLLEDKVISLEARVFELEQALDSAPEMKTKPRPSRAEARVSQMNNLQTTASLVKAGISEEIAEDIVRRRNDIELRKLELYDRATREGYLASPRYRNELSELAAQETTLREELGDDAYDRYLYINGQPNRVKVISVMMGSAAEQAGMQNGDLIVNYGELRVFEWSELKQATSEGDLGEYVSVDILRNLELINLTIPRGPLGVRLGIARIAPQ